MSAFTVNGTTYQMVDSKFTFAEAAAIERVTGHTFQEVTSDASLQGSARVLQAFIWVSIKRLEPATKFSDLDDMAIDDIVFDTPQDVVDADPTLPADPELVAV